MLRVLAAAIALTFAAPAASVATPATVIAPEDPVARAAFPNANPADVDLISQVNRFVNRVITYTPDEEQYGFDKWVTWPENLRGDCDDIALSKMASLQQRGWNVIEDARIRNITVTTPEGMYGHAALEVRFNDGSTAILDNNFDHLMTRAELEQTYGYTFFDW